jgi:Ca2+-binding RTX toxin-like protein
MATVSKPNWWAGFAAFYGFTNDSATTIDSGVILSRLNTHLVPAPSQYSNHLLSTQGNSFPPTGRIDIAVLNNNHNFLAALNGSDFISGRAGDDVLYGDAGADIFHGGAGIDLIVGNNENPNSADRDTVSYLDAASGVTVILNNAITYVANDGNGSYDMLYGIEDLVGSDFNDRLEGQDNINNTLSGGLGNDRLDGGGGNDVLTGGAGDDTIYGGGGNDVIIAGQGFDRIYTGAGADRIVLDASILDNMIAHRDYIYDFQVGADKLDISALLHAVGYQGSNPIADGYIKLSVLNGDDIKVMFDADGSGSAAPQYMAIIADTPLSSFTSASLTIDAPTTLYAAVLGQSNAKGLSASGGDSESGITRLVGQLNALTDYDQVVSVLRDSGTSQPVDIAVGGTTVDGNRNLSYFPDQIWWYPDQNRPGELAIRAVDMMAQQIADLRAQGIVKPVIIWGQGEAETRLLSRASDQEGAVQRYKDATLALFDYIKDRLGDDIEFYIMETGRYNVNAAREAGESESEIQDVLEGVALVRLAQQDMAIARDDVHLAADYTDLRMLNDSDPDTYPTDVWHMDYDDREIMGDRIGQFISYDLGYTHVIRNPGPYPVHALADLTIHPGGGGGEPSGPGTVNGTAGNDSLVASASGSVITGGQGKDSITLGAGVDTVVFGADLLPDVTLHSDFIHGFQVGPGGDRLDISGLLATVGYTGDDPIADGYLRLTADGTRTTVLFDANGPGGAGARYMAKLDGVAPGDFSVEDNLILEPGSGGGGGPLISGLEIDGSSSPDLIIGTTGADIIHGLGGNDMIVGAHGSDRLYGGAGRDDFIFDVSVWEEAFGSGGGGSLPAWADIIEDFVTGAGGDRLDISLLLEEAGYTGNDAVGDGYFSVIADSSDVLARFDADGNGGDAAVTIAKLSGVAASSFSYEDNLASPSSPLTV